MENITYTNESQIADDLHAVHAAQHRHSLAAQSERARRKTHCTYLYVRACCACLNGKGQPREIQCEEALEFCSFGFSFTYFSIHIIIGSQKRTKSRTFMHRISFMRASTWNGEEFLPFKELFGCVQCACIEMQAKITRKTKRSTDDGYKLAQLFPNSDIVKIVLACGHECGETNWSSRLGTHASILYENWSQQQHTLCTHEPTV